MEGFLKRYFTLPWDIFVYFWYISDFFSIAFKLVVPNTHTKYGLLPYSQMWVNKNHTFIFCGPRNGLYPVRIAFFGGWLEPRESGVG